MDSNIITIIKMVARGSGLGKLDGKNVFVPGTLPGETVQIGIQEEKRDFIEAKLEKVITPSEYRIQPECKYYGICGGCNLQFATAEYQRKLKTEIITDSLIRAGVPENCIPKIDLEYGSEWGYRNRFQLHDGGLKEARSSQTIPIKDCLVACPEIRECLQSDHLPQGTRTHVFGADGKVTTAVLAEKAPRKKFEGAVINEKEIVTVNINGKDIQFDVRGFFQSNLQMLEKTINRITANFGGKRCADIYSGVGTFSVFLGKQFEEMYLVEHNREALILAERNLRGIRHQSYGVSGEKWTQLSDSKQKFDAIVIDPPRSGMEKAVREWIKASQIPQIRSLSCDPVTFARDAQDLISFGYKLVNLCLLDYYPQTSHIETLANFIL